LVFAALKCFNVYGVPSASFKGLKDVSRLRWIGVGLSLSRQGSDSRPSHVGFVVEEVALGQALRFYPVGITPLVHQIHLNFKAPLLTRRTSGCSLENLRSNGYF
jgi:hypothetical protein